MEESEKLPKSLPESLVKTLNIPNSILIKRSFKLHNKSGSPICLIKERIYNFFLHASGINFKTFDDLSEVVTTENNFDLLLIPPNHPSRSKSDTYYLTENEVLRTHTSAHQNELLAKGEQHFLVTGDVYRKDEIDRFHYPVFHQMEGVHIVEDGINPEDDLKSVLSNLVEFLFPNKQYRFNSDYFPFTNPSYEVEVLLGEKWVEILGCGVIQQQILQHNGITKKGWAFGLGLERLAIILYSIPDIRLFWTDDEKFLSQFNSHTCMDDITFVPYPKIPSISKDISFWLPVEELDKNNDTTIKLNSTSGKVNWLKVNEFFDTVRDCLDSNIEKIDLIDEFLHPKTKLYSQCWRMTLSPSVDINDPGAFNEICNKQMEFLREEIINKLKLNVRG